MRNRAKCKLCSEILESFALGDYVECKCGEIAIAGGHDKLVTWAKDYANFLRVDDDGFEVAVKYDAAKDNNQVKDEIISRPTRTEMIDMLDEMAKNIERLPQHAMLQPITHADHYSLILLLVALLRCPEDI